MKRRPLLLLSTMLVSTLFANKVPLTETNLACKIFVPNAFSPNEDGINDVFQPFLGCPVDQYDLKVFNRWGKIVFESTNPDDAWDGNVNGKPAASEMYVYLLQVDYNEEGTPKTELKKGEVSLLR